MLQQNLFLRPEPWRRLSFFSTTSLNHQLSLCKCLSKKQCLKTIWWNHKRKATVWLPLDGKDMRKWLVPRPSRWPGRSEERCHFWDEDLESGSFLNVYCGARALLVATAIIQMCISGGNFQKKCIFQKDFLQASKPRRGRELAKNRSSVRLQFLYKNEWMNFSQVLVFVCDVKDLSSTTKLYVGPWFRCGGTVCLPQVPFV